MAKQSSSQELLSRLKSSLPKPGDNDALPDTSAKQAITGGPDPGIQEHAVSNVPPKIDNIRAPKLSVSLYQTDLRRLDEIKDYMKTKGFRNLSDSEALRLACRAVDIDDRFINYYRDMQREDGRRKSDIVAK